MRDISVKQLLKRFKEDNPNHDDIGRFASCEGCGKTVNVGKGASERHKVGEMSSHLRSEHGMNSASAERVATKMLKNQGHI